LDPIYKGVPKENKLVTLLGGWVGQMPKKDKGHFLSDICLVVFLHSPRNAKKRDEQKSRK
jgi:hypothetical protein